LPAQRDVLRTDVLGQFGGGPAASRIIGRAGEPGGHPRVGLGRFEVVDEIAHQQDSAGLENSRSTAMSTEGSFCALRYQLST